MEFLKSITGKIVTGVVALVVIAGGISWYSMDPSARHLLIANTEKIVGWAGVVLVLPWIAFAIIGWVARLENNLAGALLIAGFTLIETIGLFWLFDWKISGHTQWIFIVLGVLLSGVYNLLACDWIAEKVA